MAYQNRKINLLLRLIYLILRFTAWVGTSVYYRRKCVLGRAHTRFNGPAIVISNHPSTLVDVLNVGLTIRQEMYFLANYGLFKHPLSNWLLTRLFCIPVKRREDVPEGSERNLNETFDLSYRHLEKKGLLFIAPEGYSWMNRFVRPLKTGAARIALGLESRNNWSMNVCIVPFGLSYNAPHLFRSEVVVQAGEPIQVADWQDAYQREPEHAIRDLTLFIEERLKALSIHTRDERGEKIMATWEQMVQNSAPLPQKQAFYRSQGLAQHLLSDEDICRQTEIYQEMLDSCRQSDRGVWMHGRLRGRQIAGIVAGFPFFITGYALWFLPCYLPWLLNKKLGLYIGYGSTVKILAGLFTFPPAIWGMYRLGWAITGHFALSLAFIGACIIVGLIAEQYTDAWKSVRSSLHFRNLQVAEQIKLREQRDKVYARLISEPLRHKT